MERGFGVILLLRRVWDAMATHQQPMRIDRIRRTSDERDQILAGLNCQLFGIGRQNGSDLIDLIRIRVFKYSPSALDRATLTFSPNRFTYSTLPSESTLRSNAWRILMVVATPVLFCWF